MNSTVYRLIAFVLTLGLLSAVGCSDDSPLAPDNPDCPEVIFGPVIVNTATELALLEGVHTIAGHLIIDAGSTPDSIRTLAPLENLRSVEGLTIQRTAITDLRGLDNLRTVSTYLAIWDNDSLATLAGLDSLTLAAGLRLGDLPQLTSIAELRSLGGLKYMYIDNLDLLKSIDVFDDLSVLTRFSISYSSLLNELPVSTPLPSLVDVSLFSLQSLDNVMLGSEPPENLTSLRLHRLDAMVRTTGLARLSGLEELWLDELPELVDLGDFSAVNSLRELKIDDTPKLSALFGQGSLPELKFLDIVGPSSLTAMTGLPELNMLTRLTLSDHENLEALDGLSSLPELDKLILANLPALADLNGLPAMPELETMSLTALPALSSLTTGHVLGTLERLTLDDVGIIDLATLDQAPLLRLLYIEGCLNLRTLDGTESLPSFDYLYLINCPEFNSFGTGATRDNLEKVTVYECDALTHMHGFGPSPAMTELRIRDCDGLLSLTGLFLPSTMSLLQVYSCSRLQNLEGAGYVETLSSLSVNSNPALNSLDGLSGLRSANSIYMQNNTSLGNATVLEFVMALEYWGRLTFGGNDPGDKSVVTLKP